MALIPNSCAFCANSLGVSEPSEKVEWVCRSITRAAYPQSATSLDDCARMTPRLCLRRAVEWKAHERSLRRGWDCGAGPGCLVPLLRRALRAPAPWSRVRRDGRLSKSANHGGEGQRAGQSRVRRHDAARARGIHRHWTHEILHVGTKV